jgi:hypothetical protein
VLDPDAELVDALSSPVDTGTASLDPLIFGLEDRDFLTDVLDVDSFGLDDDA